MINVRRMHVYVNKIDVLQIEAEEFQGVDEQSESVAVKMLKVFYFVWVWYHDKRVCMK